MTTTRTCWIVAASLACSISTADADGMIKNGLSIDAFSKNALTVNSAALGYFGTHALNQAMFDAGAVHDALRDPAARAVMTEVVRCALSSTTALVWHDPSTQAVTSFQGELGLCQNASHPGGNWFTGAPNTTCQQIVTGCVAARVNAVGMSIPISLQGGASVPPPAASVSAETTYRFPVTNDPAIGQTIASFLPCTPAGNCGQWVAGNVGTCVGGSTVTLTATGTCTIPLRVCNGIHGCVDSTETDPSNAIPRATWLSAGSCTAAFTCPASETYSVMFELTGSQIGPTIHASTGVYPAPATGVFSVREGAFYGNMFDVSALTVRTCSWGGNGLTCVATPGCNAAAADCANGKRLPYNKVYGCFASGIANNHNNEGAVYFNDRLCAGSTDCFTHTPDRCYYTDPTDNATKGSHCTWNGQIFGTCKDPTGTDQTVYPVITTYMNAPCDIIDHATCNAIWNPFGGGLRSDATAVPRDGDDGDDRADELDDDGGCSVGRTRGGLVTLLLAAVAVVIARRSRRR